MSVLFLAEYAGEEKLLEAISEVQSFTATGGDLVSQSQALENMRMRLNALRGERYGPRRPRKPRRRVYADPVTKQNHIVALGNEHMRLENQMKSKLTRVFSQQKRVALKILRQRAREQ